MILLRCRLGLRKILENRTLKRKLKSPKLDQVGDQHELAITDTPTYHHTPFEGVARRLYRHLKGQHGTSPRIIKPIILPKPKRGDGPLDLTGPVIKDVIRSGNINLNGKQVSFWKQIPWLQELIRESYKKSSRSSHISSSPWRFRFRLLFLFCCHG